MIYATNRLCCLGPLRCRCFRFLSSFVGLGRMEGNNTRRMQKHFDITHERIENYCRETRFNDDTLMRLVRGEPIRAQGDSREGEIQLWYYHVPDTDRMYYF